MWCIIHSVYPPTPSGRVEAHSVSLSARSCIVFVMQGWFFFFFFSCFVFTPTQRPGLQTETKKPTLPATPTWFFIHQPLVPHSFKAHVHVDQPAPLHSHETESYIADQYETLTLEESCCDRHPIIWKRSNWSTSYRALIVKRPSFHYYWSARVLL